VLKVAIGPKTTTQPVVAPAGAPATGTPPGQVGGATPANTLAERRRAQQAAEAAAAAGRPPPLNAPPAGAYLPPGGTAPAGAAAAVDPRWAEADARVRARVRAQSVQTK
jgi:hypothetical protein